jgi:hypothetical protein
MMTFHYQIVPSGGQPPLTRGSLYIADVERAKQHVQTVTAHGVVAEPGMEVILQDPLGNEIWRGPYLGKGGDA